MLREHHRQKIGAAAAAAASAAAGGKGEGQADAETPQGDEHVSWIEEHLRFAALTAGGAGWEQHVSSSKLKARSPSKPPKGPEGGSKGNKLDSDKANYAKRAKNAQPLQPAHMVFRPLSDLVLLQNLRMSKKGADTVKTIHSAATAFAVLLQDLQAYNENARNTGGSGSDANTTTVYRGVGKARLGLIMRDAGTLYLPALELAVAMHLLDKLVSTQLQVDTLCTVGEALRGINTFLCDALFGETDALLSTFYLRTGGSGSSEMEAEGGKKVGAGMGTPLYASLLTGSSVENPAGDHVLAAARDLLAAIHHFDLHRDYDRAVSITSMEVREMLPNLKAGPVYGQVRDCFCVYLYFSLCVFLCLFLPLFVSASLYSSHTLTLSLAFTSTPHHYCTQVLREITRWSLDTCADNQSQDALRLHLRDTFKDAA